MTLVEVNWLLFTTSACSPPSSLAILLMLERSCDPNHAAV